MFVCGNILDELIHLITAIENLFPSYELMATKKKKECFFKKIKMRIKATRNNNKLEIMLESFYSYNINKRKEDMTFL